MKCKIVKTPMFPCCWHIQFQWPHAVDNSTRLFFRTQGEALDYIIKHKWELV